MTLKRFNFLKFINTIQINIKPGKAPKVAPAIKLKKKEPGMHQH